MPIPESSNGYHRAGGIHEGREAVGVGIQPKSNDRSSTAFDDDEMPKPHEAYGSAGTDSTGGNPISYTVTNPDKNSALETELADGLDVMKP